MQKSSATKRQKESSPVREPSRSPTKEKPTKKTAKGKKIEAYIADYDDPNIRDYERDNPNVRFGYRIFFNDYWVCARSLFMIHNETMNVWSHLIGALLFLAMIPYVLVFLKPSSLHESTSLVDRWVSDFD